MQTQYMLQITQLATTKKPLPTVKMSAPIEKRMVPDVKASSSRSMIMVMKFAVSMQVEWTRENRSGVDIRLVASARQ